MTALVPAIGHKEEFLLAGRRLSAFPLAFSVAATWIWAPALFVAAQVAYIHGWQGLAWFTIPNVLALIVVGAMAARLRGRAPDGYTFSGYMRERHGGGVFAIGIIEDTILSIAGFAVQLLAGGLVLVALTGWSYHAIIAGLAVLALSYSIIGGFRATVLTDYGYMALIAIACLVLVPAAALAAGGGAVILDGFARLPAEPWTLALSWGLPLTIGLLTGPFADQAFWQRAFAARPGDTFRVFAIGAAVFAVVPLAIGSLGALAAGAGLVVDDPQMAGLAAITAFLPGWGAVAFAGVLLAGLVSTMDSSLSAMSSIVAHEFGGADEKRAVSLGRVSMAALAGVGVAIAALPGLTILHVQLLYGMLRSASFVPGVMTIYQERVSSRGAFVGIVAGLAISMPLFVYGQLLGGGALPSVLSAILAVTVSGAICYGATRLGLD